MTNLSFAPKGATLAACAVTAFNMVSKFIENIY
jgi:hypothetical protein